MNKEKCNSLIMGIIILLLGIESNLLFSGNISMTSKKYLMVITETANIYQDPDVESKVIEKVQKGSILTIQSTRRIRRNWYYVHVEIKERNIVKAGYILISKVKEIPTPPAEKQKVIIAKEQELKKEKREVKPEVKEKPKPKPIKKIEKKITRTRPRKIEKKEHVSKRDLEHFLIINAKYFFPTEKAFKDIYGSGVSFGVEFNINIIKGFFIWGEGSYFNKTGLSSYKNEETNLNIIPLNVGFEYLFPYKKINFHIGLGFGYQKFMEESNLGKVNDGGLSYIGKLGSSFLLGKRILLNGFVKYSYCKVKPADFKVDIGGLELGLGVGYEF